MPRQASGRNEGGRERTRRYRNRLRSSGTPEADAVDYAVAASVAALAEVLRIQATEARAAVLERREELRLWLGMGMGVLQDAEAEVARAELAVPVDDAVARPEAMAPSDLLRRILLGAVALLVDRECDPAQARRKLHHRLGRGGDHAEVEALVTKSGVSLAARSRKSRGHA